MTLRYTLLFILSSFTFLANSQCLTLTNNIPDTIVYSTSSDCGVAVNYNTPVFSSSCQLFSRDTFYFTGSDQSYVVPSGVSQVTIETWGAQGGANWVDNNNFGGYNKADFAMPGGTALSLYVGGQPNGISGGFNGGGNGEGSGQGGGGATDVRIGSYTLNERIIVSGGGGGAGYWSNLHVVGGVGGGVNGGNGYRSTTADPGGLGATPTGPGATGTCVSFDNPAMAGSFGVGGSPSGCGCEGYGGGGGYYGGAASGNCRGGGGGSGFIDATGMNSSTMDGVRTGNGMIVISYELPQTIDVTQIAGLASGAIYPAGTTTNTFRAATVQDTVYYSFTVQVSDTILPIIPALQPVTFYADNNCQSTAVVADPAATDNCGIATITSDAPTAFPVGTTQINWTITDQNGNSVTTSQDVIVLDTLAPVIPVLQPITFYADNNCQATAVVADPAATDNCGIATITSDAPTAFPVGTTQINWTITDQNGNSVTTSQDVIVLDTLAPVIPALQPVTFYADNNCQATAVVADPAATDNCGIVTITNDAPTAFPVGTTQINWTITDQNGNSVTTSQDVIVLDTLAPVIPALQPVTFYADNNCQATAVVADPAATDNCGIATITSDAPTAFPVGTTQINWTITDQNGNSVTTSQDVIVLDTLAPVIPALQPVTFYADNNCQATAVVADPAATDNCGIATITSDAPTAFPVGTTQINWTITDQNGNSATAVQQVIVLDTVAPQFDGFILSYQMCVGDTIALGLPDATDNCSVTVTQISGPMDGTIMQAGQYSIAFVATDPSNNTDTIAYSVNVMENPAITMDIQTPGSVICVYHNPFTLTGADPAGGIYSGTGVSGGQFDPAVAGVGNTTITYAYTDFQGCSSSATEVLVVDACAGINENTLTNLELFPNPTAGNVTIKTQNPGMLQVYDDQGKFIMSYAIKANETSLNLSSLANGVYSLHFTDNEGKTNVSKLIIQQ